MPFAVRLSALLLVASPVAAIAPVVQGRELAHPIVAGAAGPYARVEVVLTRPAEVSGGQFSGIVRAGGRRIALPGPSDQPEPFFILEPRAVLFMSVDRSRRNGIVVLYHSSRIGPGHGTDRRALVYRLERDRAVRLPALEERLEGAHDATAVRRRLRAATLP